MRIIFLGPPGSGKGTQARLISNKYNIPNISTSVLLHQKIYEVPILHKDLYTNDILKSIHSGDLVNDKIMIKLVIDRINKQDCNNGFILDGFPRTVNQALAIRECKILIDFIIEFVIPNSAVIKRIVGRQVHVPSGRTYHIKFNPPKHSGIDDVTGEPLITRKDDRKQVVLKRLNKYYKYNVILLNYYRKQIMASNVLTRFFSINGDRKICEIYEELIHIINSK